MESISTIWHFLQRQKFGIHKEIMYLICQQAVRTMSPLIVQIKGSQSQVEESLMMKSAYPLKVGQHQSAIR